MACKNFQVLPVAVLLTTTFSISSTANAQGLDCPKECNTGTPFCLIVPTLVAGKDIPWALRHLHRHVVGKVSSLTIQPKLLLGFFGMTEDEDPCSRKETKFDGTSLINEGGSACQVAVSVPSLGGANEVKIGFDIPRIVKGNVKQESTAIVISFDSMVPEFVPTFWIDNDLLNADWGGRISQIVFDEFRTTVSTANGCIRYDY